MWRPRLFIMLMLIIWNDWWRFGRVSPTSFPMSHEETLNVPLPPPRSAKVKKSVSATSSYAECSEATTDSDYSSFGDMSSRSEYNYPDMETIGNGDVTRGTLRMTRCVRCSREVTSSEGVNIFEKVWHRWCFRCERCWRELNQTTMHYISDE